MNKFGVFFFLSVLALACGAPAFDEDRIVGGSNAAAGEFPYQVSLRSSGGSHFCGGSILNPRTIVTAAHCIVNQAASNVRVVVGTIYLNSGGTSYTVSRITRHASYNPSSLMNDVGVVITSSAIAYSTTVQPLALSTGTTLGGVSVRLSGWGTTTYPGSAPNNLQKINLSTITVSQCQSSLSSIGSVFDSQICTFTRAGEGACHGDSGGPLVGGSGLIGIVSWGSPCARGYPDVFTRVSSFASWINANAQ